jgi:hypothetical protein
LTLVAAFTVVRGATLGYRRSGAVVLLVQLALAVPTLLVVGYLGLAFMDAPKTPTAALAGASLLLPAAAAEASLRELRRETPLAWLAHFGAGALAVLIGGRTARGWIEHWWEPVAVVVAAAPYLAVLAPRVLAATPSAVAPAVRAAAVSLALTWAVVGSATLAAGFPAWKAALAPLLAPTHHVPRSVRLARCDALKHPRPGEPLRIGRHRYALPVERLTALNPSYAERLPDRYSDVVVEIPFANWSPAGRVRRCFRSLSRRPAPA